MKKWINTICAGAASLLTFIFLALPAWSIGADGNYTTFNGYQLISGKEDGVAWFKVLDVGAWKLYRIFAIILIVLAVVLALYAVFTLLVNLEVLKIDAKWINLANNVLLTVTLVVSVVALIACMRINDGYVDKMTNGAATVKKYEDALGLDKFGTQVGLWLVTAFNAVACAVAWTFSFVGKKD